MSQPKQFPTMIKPCPNEIKAMFDRLAPGYDRFNRLSSLGMDAQWRNRTLRCVLPGMSVLDIGTGTGDLAIGAARLSHGTKSVVGLDVSNSMLQVAIQKSKTLGFENQITWVCKGAEELPLDTQRFDVVVSAFVLRNIQTHLHRILRGVHESLKPSGRISFIDLTEPSNQIIRKCSALYMRSAVLLWGKLIFRETEPIHYLRNSMKRFLKPSEFVSLLKEAGFHHVKSRQLLCGLVTHYSGQKSDS